MWLVFIFVCTSGHGCTSGARESDSDILVVISIISRMARLLRIIAVAKRAPRLRLLFRSFVRMLPVIAPHFGVFASLFVFFAGIGMSMFAGLTTQIVEDGGAFMLLPLSYMSYRQDSACHVVNPSLQP